MKYKQKCINFQVSASCFLLCAFCFVLSASCFSQSVSATLDRDKFLLGEQVTLELKAEDIHTQLSPVTAWFNLPDTINHIEVVKRSPVDTVNINGTTSYIQTITITSFDSGTWAVPRLRLQLSNSIINTLFTDSLIIQVLPVDVSNLRQYHEMKDIIEVQVQPDYWLITAVIASVIVLTVLIYLFVKRKKKPALPQKPVAKMSLFEQTIAQLEALQKESPPALIFYTKLDEIGRNYIQQQLHIRAMHLTSDELMIQLNIHLQQQDKRTGFYQLLRLINTVKFARYEPVAAQNSNSVSVAKETVQYIHNNI